MAVCSPQAFFHSQLPCIPQSAFVPWCEQFLPDTDDNTKHKSSKVSKSVRGIRGEFATANYPITYPKSVWLVKANWLNNNSWVEPLAKMYLVLKFLICACCAYIRASDAWMFTCAQILWAKRRERIEHRKKRKMSFNIYLISQTYSSVSPACIQQWGSAPAGLPVLLQSENHNQIKRNVRCVLL